MRQEAAVTSSDRQEAAATSSDRQEAASTSSDRQEAAATSSDRQVGMKSKREVPNEEDYDSEEEEAPAAANGNYKTTLIGNKAEASTSTSTVKTNRK
ncbi:unnamed protein product [Arabis nemorensis]|uniref:Uncharacterized protein n=1 Tax=Arabis nemorensis TaxID=586526 RepID=A0A565BXE7_9BRAS|nr:unnamed protein product [Arabis nemorensis]